jgi:hypothetical protein
MFWVRSKVLRQVSGIEAASGHGWCAGPKKEVARERRVDRHQSGLMQPCLVRQARREEIYRDRAIVAEREANLTIVVVGGRHGRGGRRRQDEAEGGVLAKGNFMMMPAEEDSLDQDRERARQRGNPAPCPSSPTDQDHRRAAPRISILHAPAPAAEFGTRLIYYNGPGKS